MVKYFYVILRNIYKIPYFVSKMKMMAEDESCAPADCYAMALRIINIIKRTGHIKTKAYGVEMLPKEEGYIMYPNHQGKYDVLGIMDTHKSPCSFVMDKAKSYTVLVSEVLDLVKGKRLDKNNCRQALSIINEVAEEIKKGRKFILFPEGGYEFNQGNNLGEFKAGCFKIALKSKAPIVPVALIDSYKVFDSYHMGKVETQVHYLEPINYEEYKDMSTTEIAQKVHDLIEAKIEEVAIAA